MNSTPSIKNSKMPIVVSAEQKQMWYDDEWSRCSVKFTLDGLQSLIRQAEHEYTNLQKKKSLSLLQIERWIRLVARLDKLRAAEIDTLLSGDNN